MTRSNPAKVAVVAVGLSVSLAFAVATAAFAQSNASPDHGGAPNMPGKMMPGMMGNGAMPDMVAMMDSCNRMMGSMPQTDRGTAPPASRNEH